MNKLSIIIPVQNLEGYIGDCLRSIAAQNFDRSKLQVICVLDSCTDGSAAEIDSAAQETGLCVLKINANHSNCGLARNTGLENANGDWIWFVDGDDLLIDNDALSRIALAATGNAVRPMKYLYGRTPQEAETIRTTMDAYSFILEKDFIGQERFRQDDGLFESARFLDRLLKTGNAVISQIEEPIYFYRTPRAGSITDSIRHKS